jgi:hypothetical protein
MLKIVFFLVVGAFVLGAALGILVFSLQFIGYVLVHLFNFLAWVYKRLEQVFGWVNARLGRTRGQAAPFGECT